MWRHSRRPSLGHGHRGSNLGGAALHPKAYLSPQALVDARRNACAQLHGGFGSGSRQGGRRRLDHDPFGRTSTVLDLRCQDSCESGTASAVPVRPVPCRQDPGLSDKVLEAVMKAAARKRAEAREYRRELGKPVVVAL